MYHYNYSFSFILSAISKPYKITEIINKRIFRIWLLIAVYSTAYVYFISTAYVYFISEIHSPQSSRLRKFIIAIFISCLCLSSEIKCGYVSFADSKYRKRYRQPQRLGKETSGADYYFPVLLTGNWTKCEYLIW